MCSAIVMRSGAHLRDLYQRCTAQCRLQSWAQTANSEPITCKFLLAPERISIRAE